MLMNRMSRRSFLRKALGAGAAAALQGCAGIRHGGSSAGRSRGPADWALVSDTHISADLERIERGGRMSERFRLVLADILAENRQLAGMLINGDLALNRGLPGDYAALAGLLEPTRRTQFDVRFVLGNHDDRDNFVEVFHGGRSPASPVTGRCVQVVESGGCRLFLLDSRIRPNYTPGELGPEQLQWLMQELDRIPDLPCILLLHHCMRGDSLALKDEAALTEILTHRRQVKAVIQGHSHEYHFRELAGIHFVELPATGYSFHATQPIGWVRARVGPEGCDLELRAVDGDRTQHGQTRYLPWRDASGRNAAA